MSGDAPLILAAACAIGGVAALRRAWALPQRSAPANALGWALLAGGCLSGGAAAGAWGVAVTALVAMSAAFAVLAQAALGSRPAHSRASNRRVRMLPERNEPRRLGRRLATFLLIALLAAVLSIGLAVAAGWLARLAGWSIANANVLAMFLTPLAWTLLAFTLLMQTSRGAQLRLLLIASLPLWPVLAAGALA
jgi:hypothetical protein